MLGVKHGVTLHKRDLAFNLFAFVDGFLTGNAVGKNHKLAGLALADVSVKFKSLFESKPKRASVTLGYRGGVLTRSRDVPNRPNVAGVEGLKVAGHAAEAGELDTVGVVFEAGATVYAGSRRPVKTLAIAHHLLLKKRYGLEL
ncbi:MAG: hypothetical protein HQK89_02670 [Nitrospirae bacterium]|nr:hypothetical protein [Nitrospirota bacterium]